MFDPHLFKRHFPVFDQVQNQQLVYLDNAATTQKPAGMIEAISQFYLLSNGNAGRASHRLARAATDMIDNTRALAADFLGATAPSEVALVAGATEALNTVAHGLSDYCKPGDSILLSHAEHHANLLPWQRLAERSEAVLSVMPDDKGLVQWQRWPEYVNDKTRIVSFSAASNVLGQVLPVEIIAAIKQRYPSIIIVLDASQLACHQPLYAAQWRCDFLVCSAHKFYGPTGVGLLYAKGDWCERLSPLLLGGEMVDRVDTHASTYVTGPERLEAGTSSMAAIAGLQASLQFWQQQDRSAMALYEAELTAYLHEQLTKRFAEQVQVLTKADNNVGIAVLVPFDEQWSVADLAIYLDQRDIAVRVGDHCAQPLWRLLQANYGALKGLRVSLAAYNTYDDIEYLLTAIAEFFTLAPQAQLEISDELAGIDWQELLNQPWQKRYKTLLRWGTRMEAKPHIRQEENAVKGCESQVWLRHYKVGNAYYFEFDSDSNVIKGLAALLVIWVNGKTAEEIKAINFNERYSELGLEKHLSQSRSNGFAALLQAVLGIVQ